MPTISEIQDYLIRHQRPEENIDPKTQDRVTRAAAMNVKQNDPLPKGRCNLCGWEDDKLLPATMKVCLACTKKMMDRGGEVYIHKKDIEDYICDFCQSRTFTTFLVNPLTCHNCSQKIARRHKYDRKEALKMKERIKKEKIRRGALIPKEGEET